MGMWDKEIELGAPIRFVKNRLKINEWIDPWRKKWFYNRTHHCKT
jgi:hypothetical protein